MAYQGYSNGGWKILLSYGKILKLPKRPILTPTDEAATLEGYLREEDEEHFSFSFTFQLKHSNAIYRPK